MRKPIRMSNQELKKFYLHLNKEFFSNKLDKKMKLRFADDLKDEDDNIELNGCQEGDEIVLDSSLKLGSMEYIQIILLHEMCHAALPHDVNHGIVFQAKIVELFNKGAYDYLL